MTLRAILRVVLGLPYPEPLGEREARENALPLGQGIRRYRRYARYAQLACR